jgi:hypothetical protein
MKLGVLRKQREAGLSSCFKKNSKRESSSLKKRWQLLRKSERESERRTSLFLTPRLPKEVLLPKVHHLLREHHQPRTLLNLLLNQKKMRRTSESFLSLVSTLTMRSAPSSSISSLIVSSTLLAIINFSKPVNVVRKRRPCFWSRGPKIVKWHRR